jgi:hypothetical protein
MASMGLGNSEGHKSDRVSRHDGTRVMHQEHVGDLYFVACMYRVGRKSSTSFKPFKYVRKFMLLIFLAITVIRKKLIGRNLGDVGMANYE